MDDLDVRKDFQERSELAIRAGTPPPHQDHATAPLVKGLKPSKR